MGFTDKRGPCLEARMMSSRLRVVDLYLWKCQSDILAVYVGKGGGGVP